MNFLTQNFNYLRADNLTSVLTIFVVLLIFIHWLWLQQRMNYWRQHNVPYIQPKLLFGNLKELILMRKSFCALLDECYQHANAKGQSVVGIYIFNRPCLLLRDVDLIKNIMIKDFNKFSNRFAMSDAHTDPLGANNLFFIKNPKWKEMRVKLTPIFTSGKMKQMFPLVAEIGSQLDAYLCNLTNNSANQTFIGEVKEISTLFSTDVIASVAYGIEAKSFTNPDGILRTAGKQIFNFTKRRTLEIYTMFFLPQLVKIFGFKVFSPEATDFLRNLLNQIMNERSKSGFKRNDLIDLLLNFKHEAEADKDKKHFVLEGDALIAQAALFFSAGFETSSSTISFSLFELTHHQDLQARLRAEIKEVLAANVLTYEVLNEMKFLDNVIREVLRLYPVMPFLERECTLSPGEQAYDLKPFCNAKVPNGMPVYISAYSIQRDERYFPEANRFNPDRFSPSQIRDNNMAAFLAFGMGPHNCIGERFGLLQSKIGLISFLRSHCVKPSEFLPTEFQFNPRAITLQAVDGIHLKIVYDPLF